MPLFPFIKEKSFVNKLFKGARVKDSSDGDEICPIFFTWTPELSISGTLYCFLSSEIILILHWKKVQYV
jgi:hypothetical protein